MLPKNSPKRLSMTTWKNARNKKSTSWSKQVNHSQCYSRMVQMNQNRLRDSCCSKRTNTKRHLTTSRRCFSTINQLCMLSKCRWRSRWCSSNRCTTSKWCRCSNRWRCNNNRWPSWHRISSSSRCSKLSCPRNLWCRPNRQSWCNLSNRWCSSSNLWCNNNQWCNSSQECNNSSRWCSSKTSKWLNSRWLPSSRCNNNHLSWCNRNSKDRLPPSTHLKSQIKTLT